MWSSGWLTTTFPPTNPPKTWPFSNLQSRRKLGGSRQEIPQLRAYIQSWVFCSGAPKSFKGIVSTSSWRYLGQVGKQGCRFVHFFIFGNKPQMVPKDLNIGETKVWLWFSYNPASQSWKFSFFCLDLLPFWVPEMVPLRGFWWFLNQPSNLEFKEGTPTGRCVGRIFQFWMFKIDSPKFQHVLLVIQNISYDLPAEPSNPEKFRFQKKHLFFLLVLQFPRQAKTV